MLYHLPPLNPFPRPPLGAPLPPKFPLGAPLPPPKPPLGAPRPPLAPPLAPPKGLGALDYGPINL